MARAESGRVCATRRAATRTVSVWADRRTGGQTDRVTTARTTIRPTLTLPPSLARPRQHQLLQDAGFVAQRGRLEGAIGVEGPSQRLTQLAGGPEPRPPGPTESGLLPAPQAVRPRRSEVRQQHSLEPIGSRAATARCVAVELRPSERRADEGRAKGAEHADAAHASLLEHRLDEPGGVRCAPLKGRVHEILERPAAAHPD